MNPGFLPPISTIMRLAFGELSGLMKYAKTARKKLNAMMTNPASAVFFFLSLAHGRRWFGTTVIAEFTALQGFGEGYFLPTVPSIDSFRSDPASRQRSHIKYEVAA